VPCTTDADCGQSGIICTTVECACNGGTYCQPGCMSDSACAEGEVCSQGGGPGKFHCIPAPCSGPGTGCGLLFDCKPAGCSAVASPCCQRRTCGVDADCHVKNAPPAYCVDGLCYDSPGQCLPPPP
jgi:hypothetical protein